jgi:hypothetical protein
MKPTIIFLIFFTLSFYQSCDAGAASGPSLADLITGHQNSSSSSQSSHSHSSLGDFTGTGNDRQTKRRTPKRNPVKKMEQAIRRIKKQKRRESKKKKPQKPSPDNNADITVPSLESSAKPVRDQDEQEQFFLLRSLLCTINHFFGGVNPMFDNIKDPRNPEKIEYSISCLCFAGILMFIFGLKARRQIGHLLRNNGPSASKFNDLFNTEECPHGDTLNSVFKNLSVEEMQESVTSLTETLIKKKLLYRFRLFARYFVVAIDGTGILTFHDRHCKHCLTKTIKGKTIYYHNVLEAKLITSNGFALSMMTEFIENPEEGMTKQDCELRAFYRLADRLKKRFPKLSLCLTLDSLFAGGPTFELCEKNKWKYVIVLKKKLSSVNNEFEKLSQMKTGNRLTFFTGKKSEIKQEFKWVNDILYKDSKKKKHTVSVLECFETRPLKGKPNTKKYKWITNHKIHEKNVIPLAAEGGRLRWKIENEAFNAQKNGGFELEHAYSKDETAAKIFYFILQIAHIIFQLIEKGSLFKKAFPKGVGSLKNIAFRMAEAWRNMRISSEEILAMLSEKFQIRFDTS